MLIKAKPSTKYEIIEDLINKDDNLLSVKLLCEIAGVSRSGFYDWKANKPGHKTKEDADKSDLDLIL